MEVVWTEEQQKVIQLRNRNILVSAAAGSGKTAVLVERIINRIVRDDPPMDVDRLLMVTFTEAAASEMKERILDAIEKEVERRPEDGRLKQQATLIHTAAITTIHSFCLSVIREHFHTIGLDPGFRIAEEGELRLLKQDVLKELLEEAYQEGREDFLELVERFGAGKNDKKIEELILQLYEFSRGYPRPQLWFQSCEKLYEGDAASFENSPLMDLIRESTDLCVEDFLRLIGQAKAICEEKDGLQAYSEALAKDEELFQGFLKTKTYDERFAYKLSEKMGRLPRCTAENVEEDWKEIIQNLRKDIKSTLASMEDIYLEEPKEQVMKKLKACTASVRELIRLTKRFEERFAQKKTERTMIDFSDMEHHALRILTEEQDGELVPSQVAKLYQEKFKEVVVDEYQDSNLIQEAILTSVSKASRGDYNMVMVGDVKQSIYSFRLSRPELFMEKYHSYSAEDGEKQRIDLHKNFRSRETVLEFANYLFSRIMTKQLGDIEYDEDAALYVGADYEKRPGNETEVLLVDVSKSEGLPAVEETSKELEARAIALRIKELVGSHEVYDKSLDAYRKCSYRDIVILTRSVKGWTDVFAKTLNQEGIPTWTGSKEGYFKAQEIRLLLDYLRILGNPKQDIPLAAVLTSFFGKLKEEELAIVKSAYPEERFHEAVFHYRMDGQEPRIREKLSRWYEQYEAFRDIVPFTAIHDLIWKIMEETGYRAYTSALPDGAQRCANIDMLVEKACAFEKTSYKGLFHFVRYMEQLEKYDVDYGEANLADEQADTVRLMSIHKSKGLEFPIVFAAGMGKRFNLRDASGEVLLHHKLGIGMEAVDLKQRTKTTTLLKKMMQREILCDSLGEELRILYVALTRAKEKLILTGTQTKPLEHLERYRSPVYGENQLSFLALISARTYFSWILPALMRDLEEKKDVPLRFRIVGAEELAKADVAERAVGDMTRTYLEQWDTSRTYDAEFGKRIRQQFSYVYPFERERELKLKFTVSELKQRQAEEDGELLYKAEEPAPLLPKFLVKEEPLKGASRGTAYHKVMELLDFRKEYTPQSLVSELDAFTEQQKMTGEMRACIEPADILRFLETPLAKRMQKAANRQKLYAEQPFVLGVDVKEVYGEEIPETILIQGIIDVYFEEEDGLVVVDYKTDRVRSAEELTGKYHAQLAYYGEALQRLTGKSVKEKIIYSFALRETIPVC